MEDQLSETEKPGWEGRTMGFYVVRSSGSLSRPELSPGTIKHAGRFLTWFYYNPGRDEITVLLCQRVKGDEPNPEIDARNAFLKLIKKATAE